MEFYTTKFGFTVRYHDGGFCILVRDEVEIIYGSQAMKAEKKGASWLQILFAGKQEISYCLDYHIQHLHKV